MEYEGWSEDELLAREAELLDEIESLKMAREFEYLIEEGFVSVEQGDDGEWYVYPEGMPAHIEVPAPV